MRIRNADPDPRTQMNADYPDPHPCLKLFREITYMFIIVQDLTRIYHMAAAMYDPK